MVKQGVVTPEDGAGFNMESRPTTLAIAIESMRKTSNGGTYMKKAESNESNEGGAGPDVGETSEEKPTPGAAEITLEALADQFADLKDAIEEDAQARKVVEFKQSLKPGYEDEAESLYEIAKTDPVAFVREHGHKLLDHTIEHQSARGSPISPDGGTGGFDLRAEQDKLFGRTI